MLGGSNARRPVACAKPASELFFYHYIAAQSFRKHPPISPFLRLATPGGWQVLLGGSNARRPVACAKPFCRTHAVIDTSLLSLSLSLLAFFAASCSSPSFLCSAASLSVFFHFRPVYMECSPSLSICIAFLGRPRMPVARAALCAAAARLACFRSG